MSSAPTCSQEETIRSECLHVICGQAAPDALATRNIVIEQTDNESVSFRLGSSGAYSASQQRPNLFIHHLPESPPVPAGIQLPKGSFPMKLKFLLSVASIYLAL